MGPAAGLLRYMAMAALTIMSKLTVFVLRSAARVIALRVACIATVVHAERCERCRRMQPHG